MNEKPLLADQALEKLIADCDFETVLDVGCGLGHHSARLRQAGKCVTGIDYHPRIDGVVEGDYLHHQFAEPFDAIWASHVLEHQPNVGLFLQKLFGDLRDGGTLAITVPPLKHQIVGGHLTLWNLGLLLYNLVVAGFDCSHARCKRYGYNLSVITPKIPAAIDWDELRFAAGDIERLAPFFPAADKVAWQQSIHGDFAEINWHGPRVRMMPRHRGWWRRRRAA